MSRAIQLSKSPARFFEVEHLFKPQGFASETDRDSPQARVAEIMGPSLVFSFPSTFPISGVYNLHLYPPPGLSRPTARQSSTSLFPEMACTSHADPIAINHTLPAASPDRVACSRQAHPSCSQPPCPNPSSTRPSRLSARSPRRAPSSPPRTTSSTCVAGASGWQRDR